MLEHLKLNVELPLMNSLLPSIDSPKLLSLSVSPSIPRLGIETVNKVTNT